MNLREFKSEFKLMCGESWGDILEAWFEACGVLYDRGVALPAKYKYRPGASPKQTNEDNYFFDMFQNSSDDELLTIAEFCFKYAMLLKKYNKDY